MEEIILQKKMEYMDHLTSNLEDNYTKIQLEKDTLSKLEKSFNLLKPHFKAQLNKYLKRIEKNLEINKAIEQKEKTDKESGESKDDKKKDEKPSEPAEPPLPVDSE